jgi:antitoxin PrlF
MTLLTVTSKGQITLKRGVLQHLGLKPGDKIQVELLPGRKATIEPVPAKSGISEFFGSLHRPGQPTLSIEEINEITRKGWAGELADNS